MESLHIGLIADTCAPDGEQALPDGLREWFAGLDLILHAGDITDPAVLDELAALAPVVAVRGDRDRLDLPERRVIHAGGLRIGLVHGHRPLRRELPGLLASGLTPAHDAWWNGLLDYVLASFTGVDAIVFGHGGRPYAEWENGILLISPGAARMPSLARAGSATLGIPRPPPTPVGRLQRWLHRPPDRALADACPSVAILHISAGDMAVQLESLAQTAQHA